MLFHLCALPMTQTTSLGTTPLYPKPPASQHHPHYLCTKGSIIRLMNLSKYIGLYIAKAITKHVRDVQK